MKEEARVGDYTVRLDTFVVRPLHDKGNETAAALEDLGEVAELPNERGTSILRLAKAPAEDPKEAWSSLQKQLGDDVEVVPVLVDECGSYQFPVGDITIRFEEELDDDELQAWSQAHDLAIVQRSQFSPSQVTMRPAKPASQFLPEIVGQLCKASSKQRAWLDTRSQFTRG